VLDYIMTTQKKKYSRDAYGTVEIGNQLFGVRDPMKNWESEYWCEVLEHAVRFTQ